MNETILTELALRSLQHEDADNARGSRADSMTRSRITVSRLLRERLLLRAGLSSGGPFEVAGDSAATVAGL